MTTESDHKPSQHPSMSPFPSRQSSPWPAPTTPPSASHPKRKLTDLEPHLRPTKVPRQEIPYESQIAQAIQSCYFSVGNAVDSCFPTADTVVPQHEVAVFVWNSRNPFFFNTNLVNVTLFDADTQTPILVWDNLPNPDDQSGVIHAPVNDSWWGDRGSLFNGTNITYPFFFEITGSDPPADEGAPTPGPTFSAVQTTLADSIVASIMSSSSAAAAAASSASAAAAASSSSLATVGGNGSGQSDGHSRTPGSTGTRTSSLIPTGTGSGSVQNAVSSSSFPHWAIAVIVILGFLAIVASGALFFFIMRRLRRQPDDEPTSNRGSMGSASPMMANAADAAAQSPLLGGDVLAIGAGTVGSIKPASIVSPDGASTISRANSGSEAPFSGADAAIMADAFRKALRKPDYLGDQPVEEGDSPDSNGEDRDGHLLNQELAEEGRGLRNVGSSRGVRVEDAKQQS